MMPRRRVVGANDGSLPPMKKGWDVETKTLAYQEGTTELEGWLAMPKNEVAKKAAVLIIHDWTGVQDYSKKRAEQLAGLGCVVLVADIYGKGIRPSNPMDSAAEAGKYKADRALFRARLLAGLEELKKQPNVDPNRIAAIGYCFGGTGVLAWLLVGRSGEPSAVGAVLGVFVVAVLSGAVQATVVGLLQHRALHPWLPALTRRAWWWATLWGVLAAYVLGCRPPCWPGRWVCRWSSSAWTSPSAAAWFRARSGSSWRRSP